MSDEHDNFSHRASFILVVVIAVGLMFGWALSHVPCGGEFWTGLRAFYGIACGGS